jgi:hypothetical protein
MGIYTSVVCHKNACESDVAVLALAVLGNAIIDI